MVEFCGFPLWGQYVLLFLVCSLWAYTGYRVASKRSYEQGWAEAVDATKSRIDEAYKRGKAEAKRERRWATRDDLN